MRYELATNLDFSPSQAVARATLTDKAWAYYSSAADDEITHRENRAAFQRYALSMAHYVNTSYESFALTGYGSAHESYRMSQKLIGEADSA